MSDEQQEMSCRLPATLQPGPWIVDQRLETNSREALESYILQSRPNSEWIPCRVEEEHSDGTEFSKQNMGNAKFTTRLQDQPHTWVVRLFPESQTQELKEALNEEKQPLIVVNRGRLISGFRKVEIVLCLRILGPWDLSICARSMKNAAT